MTQAMRTALTCAALVVGAALVGLFVVPLFGDDVKADTVIGRGIIFGGVNALVAFGLVFVYRATRVINFSQAGFGALAALSYLLIRAAWGWNFWLTIVVVLVGTAVLGVVVELAVLRRFARSSRLVMTVVTIALGQTLLGLSLDFPEWFGFKPDPETNLSNLPTVPPATPFSRFSVQPDRIVFHGEQIAAAAVVLTALIGLALFLRFTRAGTAIRGAAENRDRASQLGVNVEGLGTVVWALVAVLGAVAALAEVLAAQSSVNSTVLQAGGTFGAGTLLRGLAPAVMARMERLPVAVAGGFAVGMFEEAVAGATSQVATVDAVLFVVVVVSLLVQRRGESRVAADDASSWEASDEIRPIPIELAGLPVVKRGIRRVLWTLALVLALYPWVMSPGQTNNAALHMIYGIIGVSLVVLTGWGGQISLGHFGFVAVGAVVGGWFTGEANLPFLIAVPLTGVVAAGVAVVVGLPALRIRGLFLAVSTMAFAVVCGTFVVNPRYFSWLLPDKVSRPHIFWVDTGTGERPYYYLCVAVLFATIFAAGGLRRSRTGRLLIAMRDNERAAQSFTINLVRTRLTAFAMSGFMAGIAGVLFVHHQRGVSIESYDSSRSIAMFLMAVLGGLGSVYAVLVGTLFLLLTTLISSDDGGRLWLAGLGTLLILMFFPTGLGSLLFRLRDGWLRRIASRNRIFVPTLVSGRLKEGDEAKIPIAERPDDAVDVETRYELVSVINEQGQSQQSKVWRY